MHPTHKKIVRTNVSAPFIKASVVLAPLFLAMPLLAFLLPAPSARADTIELEGGRRIHGIFKNTASDPVEIFTSAGLLKIPRSRLVKAVEDSPQANILLRAEFKLAAGSLSEAEEIVDQAIRANVSKAALREWLGRQRTTLGAALKNAAPSAREPWIALTRQAAEPAPVPATLLATMAAVFTDAGENKFALELYLRISEADWKTLARDDAAFRQMLPRQLEILLGARRFAEAEGLVARMQSAALPSASAGLLLLALRKAADARDSGRHAEALNQLDQFVKPAAPAIARERMLYALNTARADLAARPNFEQALRLHQEWGERLLGRKYSEAAGEIFKRWGDSLLAEGRPADARSKYEEYYKLQPDAGKKDAPSQAAKDGADKPDKPAPGRSADSAADATTSRTLLDLCDFHLRFAALKKNEYAAAFELGEWAAEHGLLTESLTAFRRAAERAELKPTAAEQIALARRQIALRHLARCAAALEKEDPRAALELISNFPKDAVENDKEVNDRRDRLRRYCRDELQRQTDLRPVQAAALLRNIEARIVRGEKEGVERDLEILQNQYEALPAAREGLTLRNNFLLRIAMERLEGGRPAHPEVAPDNDDGARAEALQLIQRIDGAGGRDK